LAAAESHSAVVFTPGSASGTTVVCGTSDTLNENVVVGGTVSRVHFAVTTPPALPAASVACSRTVYSPSAGVANVRLCCVPHEALVAPAKTTE
jgi:hypothetical protein